MCAILDTLPADDSIDAVCELQTDITVRQQLQAHDQDQDDLADGDWARACLLTLDLEN